MLGYYSSLYYYVTSEHPSQMYTIISLVVIILLYHFWVSNIDKLTEKQIHSISDKLYIVIQMIKI